MGPVHEGLCLRLCLRHPRPHYHCLLHPHDPAVKERPPPLRLPRERPQPAADHQARAGGGGGLRRLLDPIHIFILVEALGSTAHSTAALSSYYFCIALGYTNSSLNPILYAFLDENFKRCFRDFCFPIKMRMERQSTSRVRNTVQDPAYVREVDGVNKPV